MWCIPARRVLLLSISGLLAAVVFAPTSAAQKDSPEPPALSEQRSKLTLTLDPGGHTALVEKVFFTPDSRQAITLGRDHSIRIWDVDTGRTVKVLHPPGRGGLLVGALSPDGKRLAVASRYGEGENVCPIIYVLALPEGRIERMLRGHAKEIAALAFAPDGKRLASGGKDTRLWNLEKDEPAQVLRPAPSTGLAFSPDGQRLARVHPANAEIIDLATGQKQAALQPAHQVCWSPDGKSLATIFFGHKTSPDVEILRVYDDRGKPRWQKYPNTNVSSIAFSNDSQKLLVTFGINIESQRPLLLEVATGKETIEFGASSNYRPAVWDGALSPDGKLAATLPLPANKDRESGHLAVIWKTKDGNRHQELGARNWIGEGRLGAAWSADGQTVSWKFVQRPPSFHLRELQFGRSFPTNKPRGAVSRQGDLTLQQDGKFIKVAREGKPEARFPSGLQFVQAATLMGDNRAVLGGNLGRLLLMDLATGKELRRFVGHTDKIVSLAPSPDKRYFMSLSLDQTLCIWNPERDRPLLTLYVNGQDWVLWTPEGYYAATPGGERLMGWTVDNGIDQMPTFYPLERFRKALYRPDVIKLVLEKGSVAEALKAADAARGQATRQLDLEQILPPHGSLTIVDKTVLPKVKLRGSATAATKGQPVTALRLLVDGRPLPEGAGHTEFKEKVNATAEWTVTLPPGKHSLAVLARSADASSVSEVVEVACPLPVRQATLHVLAVGIDAYKAPIPPLQFAAADAQAVADAFSKHCKGTLFPKVAAKALLDQKASRPAVLAELANMRKTVSANDLVVVYFAGHGIKEKDKFYLLTVEANPANLAQTAVSGEDLRKALGEFPCQVLLMLDACHAAAGLKNFRPVVDDLTRTLTDDECGVAVLCAAMAHEKALEKGGNGLFSRAVVQALGQAEGVPFNHRDRRQYVHHLHSFVFDEVKGASNDRQHPFLCLPWVVESFALRVVGGTSTEK